MNRLFTRVSRYGLMSPALFAVLSLSLFGQAIETITNDDVIAMLKAGLTSTVVVNKIRTSRTQFDLSTKELIRLKQNGVTDEILEAMQGYSETTETRPRTAAGVSVAPISEQRYDENDPLLPHDIGIYLYAERGGQRKLTQLEPAAATATRTSGTLGTAVTNGLWPTKVKERIPGRSANYEVTEAQPIFYFYLNQKDRTMQAVKYFPASVNQFQLVRLNISGNTREITVSKASILGQKTGMYDSSIIEFSYEKVGDGIFKIIPKQPLKNGEYGFYLLGTGASVGATFYDFRVHMVP